jgi:hypothetical protein
MPRYRLKRIRDLGIALKDLEPHIKNPRFLRVGREYSNFRLRPREVLANWLLCAVGNFQNDNENLTFSEDPTGGDGIILNQADNRYMATEHVFIPPPRPNSTVSVEDLIVQKIEHKMRNGAAYARGKHLIVFSEAIGWWYPNRVGRRIAGQHEFASVWVVGLERGDESGFLYWVTCPLAGPVDSFAWRVSINANFTSWQVERVQ